MHRAGFLANQSRRTLSSDPAPAHSSKAETHRVQFPTRAVSHIFETLVANPESNLFLILGITTTTTTSRVCGCTGEEVGHA